MKHSKTKQVIKNIAVDCKISTQEAENIITTVFEFIKDEMSNTTDRDSGYFPIIRIPNFGTFYVPKTLQEKFKEINKKKLDESDRV